jgi:hypothetical protein
VIVSAVSPAGGCDVFRVGLQGTQHLLWHDSRSLLATAVSPDGRHAAFASLQGKVNAWLAENF